MIIRKNRFHGHHSVSRVRGATVHGSFVSQRFAAREDGDYRAAVVVSKKVDKRAVVRNRIRRRLFEIIRLHSGLRGKPIDIILYVKTPDAATAPHDQLALEINSLINTALTRSRL